MCDVVFKKPYSRWLFGGIGFHQSEVTMTPLINDTLMNERILKSYYELSPTFARIYSGFADWTEEAMERFAEYYHKTFAKNDCSLYIVPGRIPTYVAESDERVCAWAENVAKRLKYLIEEKDCRLIRYYCITNEMSIGNTYAAYASDLEKFKRHNKILYDAFQRYGLENLGIVATDASGADQFWHVGWAAKNMDEITDTYCTHLYQNGGFAYGDAKFYDFIYRLMATPVEIARLKQKRFILGEFGLHNSGSMVKDKVMVNDIPDGFNNQAEEERFALMSCVMALAAMNAGVYAMAYWTLADYPDPFISDDGNSPEARARHEVARFSGHGTSIRYNKSGLFRWSENGDYSSRAYMYSLGLLAKYFRKNARLLEPAVSNENIVCAGVTNPNCSTSLCIINYSDREETVSLSSEHKADKPYRVYSYQCGDVPYNQFNDLQGYSFILEHEETAKLTMKPNSMLLLTTDYIDRTPSVVEGVKFSEDRISWNPSKDTEHCYYRVYENGVQIGSTAAEYLERATNADAVYAVRSVDRYGNEG